MAVKPVIHGDDHTFGAADGVLDRKWVLVGSGGSAPGFENGCGNVPGGEPVSFTVAVGGYLRIRGHFTAPSAPLTVFTLPEPYRPPFDTPQNIPTTDPDGIARVMVQADGQVVYVGMVTASGTGGTGGGTTIPGLTPGTYGDPTHVPQITVNTSGDVIDITDVAISGGGGPVALDDLTDVVITTPAAADRLRYDGSTWRNSALIWRPVMTLEPSTGQWLPVVDGSGNCVMTEA